MNRRTRFALSLALSLSLIPFVAVAEEGSTKMLEELSIELASTPEQHMALAQYYREKADEADREAARHKRMRHGYLGAKGSAQTRMSGHCSKLVTTFEQQAAEYRALAELHEAEAN